MGEQILNVKNVSVTVNKEKILDDISFGVNQGDALAIIGPNGAGKTVLFRTLLGLFSFTGEIEWKKGIRIGYAPQKFFVDRGVSITVKEFFLLKHNNFWFPRKEFLDHLAHELALVGLGEEVLTRQVSELSGGQMQRILIAWAMINHPDVLLFDEPTAGIDVGAEETIYTILHKLQKERGTTILLISHDLNVVYRYADNVLCINKEMICHGKPHDILNPDELARIYGEGAFYHHVEKE
ncbi:MAG: metal ABC transporter ATP-binding protein [Candidatus Sungbacteria bacterium]|nr:metal ABC transporter ATP-binding protein [bacterium]MDZ4260571.1 metal ABC transporter ATP-binding protein [Candidatus Sungbacteria bacterium]